MAPGTPQKLRSSEVYHTATISRAKYSICPYLILLGLFGFIGGHLLDGQRLLKHGVGGLLNGRRRECCRFGRRSAAAVHGVVGSDGGGLAEQHRAGTQLHVGHLVLGQDQVVLLETGGHIFVGFFKGKTIY